MQLLVNK